MTTTNGTTKTFPNSQIEGLQTVVPVKITHPRFSRQISVADDTDTHIYRQRCHIILYYQSTHPEEDSGWVFAGVTKESLGRATEEHPIIGGRLRRAGGGDVAFEVVSNDCGVRLVEARMEVKLSEFLDLEGREEAEAELVFWKDVDEENPQFCPLLYVQVTNFLCGGYSIGISCSLLLADPLALTKFLKDWAKIHTKMVSKNIFKKLPLHYLPNLKSHIKNKILSDPVKNCNKSIIFTNRTEETSKKLALVCIEEAEKELGLETPRKTRLLMVTSFKEVKMESYLREPVTRQLIQDKLTRVGWDHFGTKEISFYEGNKPVRVSNWVYSDPDEVLVILNPSNELGDSSMSVIVSIPS